MRFVSLSGAIGKARRYVSGSDNVQDEQVRDPQKLSEILRGIMRRVTAVEATVPPEPIEFEVNVPGDGSTVSLMHNFGQDVRYSVVDWRADPATSVSTEVYCDRPISIFNRAFSVGTWINSSSNITVGAEFRMKTTRKILGVRFGFNHSGKNVKASLWRNDTGALLASKTVATSNRGIYEAIFDTPVDVDLTGTDITVGTYNTTDTNWTYNNDTALATTVYEVSGDLRVVHQARFSAGDARPTTLSAGGYFMMEPILGGYTTEIPPSPSLSASSSSTKQALVLNSYVAGKAVIRVEPTQNGV